MSKDQNHGLSQAAFPVPMAEFAGSFVATDIQGMSLRDYAAIHLRVPCSDKEWLNQAISISSDREMLNSMAPAVFSSMGKNKDFRQDDSIIDFALEKQSEILAADIDRNEEVAKFFENYGGEWWR